MKHQLNKTNKQFEDLLIDFNLMADRQFVTNSTVIIDDDNQKIGP